MLFELTMILGSQLDDGGRPGDEGHGVRHSGRLRATTLLLLGFSTTTSSMPLLSHFVEHLADASTSTSMCLMSGVESRAAAQPGKSTDSSTMVLVEEGRNSAADEHAGVEVDYVGVGVEVCGIHLYK
jgi:hypothetical protein